MIDKHYSFFQEAEAGDSIGFTVSGVDFETAKKLLGSANKSKIVFSEDGSVVNRLQYLNWGEGQNGQVALQLMAKLRLILLTVNRTRRKNEAQ